jgi:hypothetical protein
MRRSAIVDGDVFGKIEEMVEGELARGVVVNG